MGCSQVLLEAERRKITGDALMGSVTSLKRKEQMRKGSLLVPGCSDAAQQRKHLLFFPLSLLAGQENIIAAA